MSQIGEFERELEVMPLPEHLPEPLREGEGVPKEPVPIEEPLLVPGRG